MTEYVRVKNGYQRAGQPMVRGGQVLPEDHELVKGMPEDYFEPLTSSIERATRRPGEVRVTPGVGPRKDATVMKAKPKRARRPRKGSEPPQGNEPQQGSDGGEPQPQGNDSSE